MNVLRLCYYVFRVHLGDLHDIDALSLSLGLPSRQIVPYPDSSASLSTHSPSLISLV